MYYQQNGFSKSLKSDDISTIESIKNYEYPILDDKIYDWLLDRIVEWYFENKTPIAKPFNPNLDR